MLSFCKSLHKTLDNGVAATNAVSLATIRNSQEIDALAATLVRLRQEYDDWRIVSGPNVDSSGFSLLALIRNEMYFLPSFLTHYRALGVERFVFLNDRSNDGSIEYLSRQTDTVVVETDHTYGADVHIPRASSNKVLGLRAMDLWRSLLHEKFAPDRWALQVDVDEFVHLPPGMTFPELAARINTHGARVVWGVMLDVYPSNIAELVQQEMAAQIDVTATWYFDGEQHLRLRHPTKPPAIVHAGARARLYQTYGVDRLYSSYGIKAQRIRGGFRNLWRNGQWLRYNALQKPVLLKSQGNFYTDSHNTNLPASTKFLLPIQHFRFSGALIRKIGLGLNESSYYRRSADHHLLNELMRAMKVVNGSFLYDKSRALTSFHDLVQTNNARGL